MQKMFRSFIKNGRERKDRCILLKRTDAQPCPSASSSISLWISWASVSPLAALLPSPNRLLPSRTSLSQVKELKAFLGAVNFYHRFVPAAANILLPLIATLKGGKKGSEKLVWTSSMSEALTNIKKALLRTVCLAFPKETAELSLASDASATQVGASGATKARVSCH